MPKPLLPGQWLRVVGLTVTLLLALLPARAYNPGDTFNSGELKYEFYSNEEVGVKGFVNDNGPTTLVIPSSVNYDNTTFKVIRISDSAFKKTDIESVTIPGSVTEIHACAFDSCMNLKSIVIPEGVQKIGRETFARSGLTSITLPQSLTEIGSLAFAQCKSLKTIDIPYGVTFIGDRAFEASGLTSATLPESLTEISEYTFSECENLTSVSIPKGVKSLGERVFQRTGLISIELPDSLKEIPGYTFGACKSLTSVIIPEGVTKIGGGAFTESGLESIKLPESLIEISARAFSSCKGLTSIMIPDAVSTIENDAFRASGLESATLPKSITEIPAYAFAECNNLTSIVIKEGVTKINDAAFDQTALISVELPKSLTEICDNAFNYCSNLTSISIPENVTRIGGTAFANTGITSLTLPASLTEIGGNAFNSCKGLTSVDIPEGVKTIGRGAFNSTGLKTVTLPASLEQIGSESFYCDSLTSIVFEGEKAPSVDRYDGNTLEFNKYDVIIYVLTKEARESYLPIAGNYPVKVLGAIEEFEYNGLKYSVHDDTENVTVAGYTSTYEPANVDINSEVTFEDNTYKILSIGDEAFMDCQTLENVELSEGLTSIGIETFKGCRNLSSINIPQTVTTIGRGAFCGCVSLDSIVFPANLTSLGDYSMAESGIKTITFLSLNPPEESAEQCLQGLSSDVIIYVPAESVDSYKEWTNNIYTILPIGSVVSDEFECEGLRYRINKESETPSVELIGVVEGNTNANVNIPTTAVNGTEEYSVVGIAANAFPDNQDIKSVKIPASVASIGDGAFAGCDSLTVTMPGNIESMGDGVFENCTGLIVSIETPKTEGSENNTTLGTGFAGTPITEVKIFDEITEITPGAFENCDQLTSIVIPDQVETIGASTFEGCTSLANVTLGSSVSTIAPDAFAGAEAITEVVCLSTTPPAFEEVAVVSRAFEGGFEQSVYANATLIVPAGTEAEYRSAEVWKNFVKIQEVADVKVTVTVPEQVILFEGENFRLTPVFTPALPDGYTVSYRSDRPYVATVDENGYISAVGAGVAGITVSVKDKNGNVVTATTNVAVGNDVSQLYDNVTIPVYRAMMVPLVLEPLDYLIGFMTCEAENPDIVTAYNNGSIYGNRIGETNLKMTFGLSEYNCKVKVVSEIRDIEIHTGNGTDIVPLGSPLKLYATTPDGDPVPVTWEMYSSSVASINYYTGDVTTAESGSCTIIARAVFDPELVAYYVLNVTDNPATGLTLDKSVLEMNEGETEQLTATTTPGNADAVIVWTSSNEDVATLSASTGEVTAVSAGTVTITATDAVTGISASCTVTVSKPSGIEGVDTAAISVRAESGRIIVKGAPADAAVEIFDIAGSRIALERGDCSVSVNAGIYVVRVAGTTIKVAVK